MQLLHYFSKSDNKSNHHHLNILSARPLITALAEVGFQPGTTGFWSRDITFRPPDQLDPRMGTGSATISIRRTEASDQTLYDLYVTRTKSLQILGQDSQPTWHLHRSDSAAEIEEDSIALEPPSLEAKRGFQFAIAMQRAGGVKIPAWLTYLLIKRRDAPDSSERGSTAAEKRDNKAI